MKRLCAFLACIVFVGVNFLQAQTVQITGTVTSAEDGLPVPGASVTVKGTTIGTATDLDGNYSLSVPTTATTMVFSFVGYVSQEIEIAGQTTINVVLQLDAQELEEVIVVAYGTQRRESFTGSAASVRAEQIERVPVTSVEQTMLGAAPGIQMGSTSGQPGSFTQIRIRGTGSISSSNEPLYVVDGVPVATGSITQNTSASNTLLATINPNDIESITILKDAAAASLYGSRAANGVILITTKQGKEGKTRFRFKSELGFTDYAYNNFELATREQAYEVKREGFYNQSFYVQENDAAAANAYADERMEYYFPLYDPNRPASDYDWESELFRKGEVKNVEFSASGGTERTKFFASMGYLDQLGHILRSDFERFTGRLNLSHQANDRISVGFNTSMTKSSQNVVPDRAFYYVNAFFASRFYLNQLDPIRLEDGTFNQSSPVFGSYPNLVRDLPLNKQVSNIFRSNNQANLSINIIEGLSFRSTLGFDAILTDEDRYWSPISSDGETHNGYGHKRHRIYNTLTSSNVFNYSNTFAALHNIDMLAGYEIESVYSESTSADGHDYPNATLPALSNAANPYGAANSWSDKRMISFLSRGNYNFDNKYYISFSFRRDGSSQLGENNRWGNFWSASAAWRLTQEPFLQGIDWLNDWKFRASFGTNGTLPTAWYGHQAFYGYGYNYNNAPGSRIIQEFNPNLSWEKNNAFNVGTDFKIFDFLTLEIEYYTRMTTDLLLQVPVSRVSGFSTTWQNVGEMSNKGIEFSASSVNIITNDFQWTTMLNLSHNKNEIVKLYQGEPINQGAFRLMEGSSYNTMYLKEWAGVDPEDGRGMWYMHDEDGNRLKEDGEYVTTKVNGEATFTTIGATDPLLYGGLTNTISYKGIDFSFMFAFKIGGMIYATPQYFFQDDGQFYHTPVTQDQYENRWKGPGDNSSNPMYNFQNPSQSNFNSSRRIHDADYLRLKSLSLGYTLPKQYTQQVGIDGARVYLSAFNLLTFAKQDLLDPEVDVRGQYYSEIPPMRTFTFGLEFNF